MLGRADEHVRYGFCRFEAAFDREKRLLGNWRAGMQDTLKLLAPLPRAHASTA